MTVFSDSKCLCLTISRCLKMTTAVCMHVVCSPYEHTCLDDRVLIGRVLAQVTPSRPVHCSRRRRRHHRRQRRPSATAGPATQRGQAADVGRRFFLRLDCADGLASGCATPVEAFRIWSKPAQEPTSIQCWSNRHPYLKQHWSVLLAVRSRYGQSWLPPRCWSTSAQIWCVRRAP